MARANRGIDRSSSSLGSHEGEKGAGTSGQSRATPEVKVRASGAIVCEHVGRGTLPIARATRDRASAPEDSGWQFLCRSGLEHDPDRAEIWSLATVLDIEPDLSEWLDYPAGTSLIRDAGQRWQRVA